MTDSSIKPDNLFDSLVNSIDVSSLAEVVNTSWSETTDSSCQQNNGYGYGYDRYGRLRAECNRSNSVSRLAVRSYEFKVGANLSRVGFVTPKQEEGNTNEFIFEANLKIPVPLIELKVCLNDSAIANTTTQNTSAIEVSAVSSKDIVLTVKFIVNKRWRKIFVSDIQTKERSVFRPSFKCRSPQSFATCKAVKSILSNSILTTVDENIREILKFRIEEIEPDLN